MIQESREPCLGLRRQGMLQSHGLVVDPVPGKTEDVGEQPLREAMPAQDTHRQSPALDSQGDTPRRTVLHKSSGLKLP